jgi:hypothetical protein
MIDRVALRGRGPSLRASLWLGAALALVSAGLPLRMMKTATAWHMTVPGLPLIGAAWAIILLAPPFCAAAAALLTVRFISSDTYQLVRLTPLTSQALVRLHVTAALYHIRLLAALAVGLTPGLVLGMAYRTAVLTVQAYPTLVLVSLNIAPLPPPATGRLWWRIDQLGWMPEFYGWAIGMWGALLLAVTLGVGLALRLRNGPLAAAGSSLLVLAVTLGLLAAIPILPLEQCASAVRTLAVLVLASAPYLMGAGGLWLIRRWA